MIAVIPGSIAVNEFPSGMLRWRVVSNERAPILEQQWTITHWQNGKPLSQEFEWREIPVVDERT